MCWSITSSQSPPCNRDPGDDQRTWQQMYQAFGWDPVSIFGSSIGPFRSAHETARMVKKRPASKAKAADKVKKPPGAYNKPVSAKAWAADKLARSKGRVHIFNSTRPHGMDGWTMDLKQYTLMRKHILECIKKKSDASGAVALQYVVNSAQERYKSHSLFPKGRLTNYVRYTKVDLEARGEIERMPGSGSQRIRLR